MSGKPGKQYQEQMELATPKEWQELVPAAILEEVAKEQGGDVKDGKLTAPVHFWILIVGVLCPTCSSLKDLISRFAKRFGSWFGLGQPSGQADENPWVSPSALSQRNAQRPVSFWQQMYQRRRGNTTARAGAKPYRDSRKAYCTSLIGAIAASRRGGRSSTPAVTS